jgi:hypothetical protein
LGRTGAVGTLGYVLTDTADTVEAAGRLAGASVVVAALVAGGVMVPFYAMSRREPALAAG